MICVCVLVTNKTSLPSRPRQLTIDFTGVIAVRDNEARMFSRTKNRTARTARTARTLRTLRTATWAPHNEYSLLEYKPAVISFLLSTVSKYKSCKSQFMSSQNKPTIPSSSLSPRLGVTNIFHRRAGRMVQGDANTQLYEQEQHYSSYNSKIKALFQTYEIKIWQFSKS